jgi:hypothetical protein
MSLRKDSMMSDQGVMSVVHDRAMLFNTGGNSSAFFALNNEAINFISLKLEPIKSNPVSQPHYCY